MKSLPVNAAVFFLFSAMLISCNEILMEEDVSTSEVELIAPSDHAEFESSSVTFTWNGVDDAINYKLEIARPNFESPLQIVLDTVVTHTSFSHQLVIGQYQWRVKAVNGSSNTAYTTRSFTIQSNDDFQYNTVMLTSPASNFVTDDAQQMLSWQAVSGATEYQIQIYNSEGNVVLDQHTSDTNYSFTFPEGVSNWRVRASNDTESTLFTSRSILVDMTNPTTATLASPLNASTVTSPSVVFEWTRAIGSGSSEKDSIYVFTDSEETTLHSKDQALSPYSKTLSTGTYYWKVKSFDAAGNVGEESNTFSFTIN
ncbi:MAG TPA: hypothetical protein VF676_04645 [Flavobacterium sp.]|jgi:hypothetical protein